jgi:hypothetical protein
VNVEIEDWKNGWYGIRMAIDAEEISRLIELLSERSADFRV